MVRFLSALVIVGSDKLGTIYCLYGSSEQIGVSTDIPSPTRLHTGMQQRSLDHPSPLIRYPLSFRPINNRRVLISIAGILYPTTPQYLQSL
jgi:hypothetical protein